MEQDKFSDTADKLKAMLSTVVMAGVAPGLVSGEVVFYNAYFNGTEVVVLGYQYERDGHTYTKPICIAVDDEVMTKLRVDHETGRYEGDPDLQDPKVV